MNSVTCPHCSAVHSWNWEEAFDKFGFDDGDGIVMTGVVAGVLRRAGYVVTTHEWGMHNVVITGIDKDGVSLIPETAAIGTDEPRKYLPQDVIDLLDDAEMDDDPPDP